MSAFNTKTKLNYYFINGFVLLTLLLLMSESHAQKTEKNNTQKIPFFNYKNGISLTTPDSLFSIQFRFRMQNRVGYRSTSEVDFTPSQLEFRVRRLRFSLRGFAFSPRLKYYLQLSFTRADMDWEVTNVPNVVRDAMVMYEFKNGVEIGIGQTKLPGNRERITSSAELQFVDRSIINSPLTLDRDFGLFLNYTKKFNTFAFKIKTAITSGEGRNQINSDYGLAYSGKVELFPLGTFTENTEYMGGDPYREPKPKLMIGGGAHFNHRATRTGGQTGLLLYEKRDLFYATADIAFKYKGISFSSEYSYRYTDNPYTFDTLSNKRFVFTGQGVNTQLGYCFPKMYEISFRHTMLFPDQKIYLDQRQITEYTLGLSKYINKHRIKIQTDVTYHTEFDRPTNISKNNYFEWRFQVELGI